MSLNKDGPHRAAEPYNNGINTSASVATLAQPEGVKEELQAKISVGIQQDSELAPVATLAARSVLSPTSINDDEQIEAEALDIKTLSMRMKVAEWRCGGYRLDGGSCQRQISEKRQNNIRSHLDHITTLLQSSKNIEDELEALVMHVHCHDHDHGYAKEERLELWAKAFPQGSANSTVTIEKQIKKVLGRLEQKCIGITGLEKRCLQNIGGQKVQNCLRTIDEILQPDVYEDTELLEGYLRVLEANMYCYLHIDKQGYKRVSTWKLSIMEILEKSKTEFVGDANIIINSVEDVSEAIGSEAVSENIDVTEATLWPNRQLPTPRNTRSLSPEFYHSPSKFWPSARDASPFKRLPRLDGVPTLTECYNLVKKTVTRNLAKTHNIEGYVYLYEVEGNEGFVKIGYTKDLEKRHKDWAFDCNRETKVLYPPKHGRVKVPNAPRVEALCHAELDYCRIRVYCGACLKEHKEWFEISAEKCIQVIQKWSQWMRTDPFENLMTYKAMLLKQEEIEKMKDMDEFMKSVAMLA